LTSADRDRGRVRLVVQDNGPGVGPAIRSRIFEPFFTTKQPGMGTGIGLSMCLSIVNAHGGTIAVADTPGGGASFVVELPVRDIEASAALAPGTTEAIGTGCRILIVDDEPEIAETLAEMLGAEGHTAETAENGSVALQRLVEGGFDAVISDLRMPILDGPGLYREIGRHHPDLLSHVGFVTGDSLSPAIQRFLGDHEVICLEKPFVRDEVRRMLAKLLPPASGSALRPAPASLSRGGLP
jgi:CheY-like chemotaxis protein